MRFDRERILVVGGSSGIGFAVAEAALAGGASVTIASTCPDRLAAAASRLDGAETARLDIADEGAVQAFFAACGGYDHIVSTAGDWPAARRTAFADLDFSAAEALFRVRFWGGAALAKHGARVLPPGGSITLTGGMTAHRPVKGSAIATAMAGAVEHLVRGLAVELAPVRVNGVCPGPIRTEAIERLPPQTRDAIHALVSRQPLARIGEPGEAAEAYLYLMRGGYTTGQILRVEGGWSIAG